MSLTFTNPLYLWALLLIPLLLGLAALAPRALSPLRRRVSLLLRGLILAALVLALAGAQLRRAVDDLTVVFLVDVSDSMPTDTRALVTDYLRQAVEAMPEGDRAAVVLFGRDALVERTASEVRRIEALASTPVESRTDIESAIQLGLALLPGDTQRRLVLISDGQQNQGDARRAADLVAARQVVLDTVPLGGSAAPRDVAISALELPSQVGEGQRVAVIARLQAAQPGEVPVRVRLFGDNQLLGTVETVITNGSGSARFELEPTETGFVRYRAVVEPLDAAQDGRSQNNEAAAFTNVIGPPRVALVTSKPEEAEPMRTALQAARINAEIVAPEQLPTSLEGLAAYSAIVLVDVQAPALPAETMAALPAYVRDLGRGLMMVGGPTSYGAGQWLRTPVEEALPVDMEVRPRDQRANIALVLAVDKSGSMGRCHCDDPTNAAQEQARAISGLPKVDIAKQAVVQSSAALSDFDFVGVVAFDGAAYPALPIQRFPGTAALGESVAPIDANGNTNIFAGLSLAEEQLSGVDARVKHIILLTDGWSRAGDFKALADRFAEEGITLSVVAAGGGSAPDLEALATDGGGQYYPAVTMDAVPQIFLNETIRIAGNYIIEKPFYPTLTSPHSILDNIALDQGLPGLLGYNGSTLKADATQVLAGPEGYPLLATRSYGLGRTVAWTSDLTTRWADAWVADNDFPQFVSGMVGWMLPRPQASEFQVRTVQEGDSTVVEVVAQEQDGTPINGQLEVRVVQPDLTATEGRMTQVGSGRYRSTVPLDEQGAYFVTVTEQGSAGATRSSASGVVVPYSPEYRIQPPDTGLLGEMAAQTQGVVRALADDPATLFAVPQQRVTTARELWPWLLLLALLLFPFDVAVRRVLFSQRDVERFRERVAGEIAERRAGTAPAPPTEAMQSLRAAKERATRRPPSGESTSASLPTAFTPPPAAPGAGQAATPAAPSADDSADTLARLREAKRRTRR